MHSLTRISCILSNIGTKKYMIGTKRYMVRKLLQSQNKAMRIINFKPNDHPTDAIYHSNKILKIID